MNWLSTRNFEFSEATHLDAEVLNEAQECGGEDIRIASKRLVLEFSTFCFDRVIFWVPEDQINALEVQFLREIWQGFDLYVDVKIELRWLEHDGFTYFKSRLSSNYEIVQNAAGDLWPVLLRLQERLDIGALVLLDFIFVDFLDIKKIGTT